MGGKTGGTTQLPYGGGSTQSGSNTYAPSTAALGAYQNVLGQLGSLPNFQNYGGELVAGINQQQQQGIADINQYANAAQPWLNQAGANITAAGQPITAAQIQNYQNPYTQQVVNATQALFNNQNQQGLSNLQGNAASQGALGGDRVGVAQANYLAQAGLGQGQTLANLYSQGYGQALQEANVQQQNQMAAGYGLANVGQAVQNAGLSGASAEFGAGTAQQQTQQALDTAQISQYLSPYQQLQAQAGIAGGIGSLTGGTNTGTQTGMQQGYSSQLAPSPLNAIAGLATAGVGAGIQGGVFKTGAAGGRVSGFADGGSPSILSSYYSSPLYSSPYYSPVQMQHGNTAPQQVAFSPMSKPNQPGAPQESGGSNPLTGGMNDIGAALKGSSATPTAGTAVPADAFVGPTQAAAWPEAADLGAGSAIAGGGEAAAGGVDLAALAPDLLLLAKRGGRVRGFAEGGDTSDDDIYFNPSSLSGVGTGSGSFINTGNGPIAADEQTPSETIAPGPARQWAGVQNVRGGESAPIGLQPNPLAATRQSFIDETNDPRVRARLDRLTEAEVGGQGPAQARKFQEGVFNRAASRGQTLTQAMNDRAYYPRVSIAGKSPSDAAMYSGTLGDVLSGSNASRYATGNASDTVGFAGGPETSPRGPGRDAMGIEGSDLPWARSMAYAQNQAGVEPDKYSDAPDIIRNGPKTAGVAGHTAADMVGLGDVDEADMPEPVRKALKSVQSGLNSPNLGLSLMAAGFGMAASPSHYFGQAIGAGGLQGVQTYSHLQQQDRSEAEKQKDRELRVKALEQQADFHRDTTQHQKDVLEETKAQHEFDRLKPQVMTDYDTGRQYFVVRDPKSPLGYRVVDPKEVPKDAIAPQPKPSDEPTSPAPVKPPGTPEATAPSSPNNASVRGPKVASLDPNVGGLTLSHAQLLDKGPFDYSTGGPYLEKGMEVPEPKEVAGKSKASMQTDAEYFLQTGKLPPAPARGSDPYAIRKGKYRDAVQNYGNALAASRGMKPEDVADAWRSSPGMLRFILGADGRSTVALGTAMRHLDTLREYAKAWNAGDQRTLSRLQATISREFGGTAATNLESVAHIVGPEIIKAIGVAGGGTAGDREGASGQFTTARSFGQVTGAIDATQRLMLGQLEGKQKQAAAAGVDERRFKNLVGEQEYERLSQMDKGGGGGGTTAPAQPQTRTIGNKTYTRDPATGKWFEH